MREWFRKYISIIKKLFIQQQKNVIENKIQNIYKTNQNLPILGFSGGPEKPRFGSFWFGGMVCWGYSGNPH